MRKFLGLLMLVPFAAILVLSCDDHPTAPEEVQAATTVQESSTPQATKAPPLPTPVVLADWHVTTGNGKISANSWGPVFAYCPDGTFPIGGGFSCSSDAACAYSSGAQVIANGPHRDDGGPDGWQVWYRNDTSNEMTGLAYAVCVAAVQYDSGIPDPD